MTRGFPYVLRIAVACHCCLTAYAFQGPEGPLQMMPKALPKVEAAPNPEPMLRIDSSLVLVPVHVITNSGASVTGLKKEDFELFEDGKPQPITHFSQGDAPVSAGLLLDVSSSMKNKMAKVAEAATEFFKFANADDEFFLVEFNGRAKLKVPFTRECSQIAHEISAARTSGMTALLDAVHLGVAQMKKARNVRKALIVLSDGGDNFSRRSMRELTNTLIEADVQVYALGVFDRDFAQNHSPEERNGPRLLDQVALDTGGRDFPVVSLDNLPTIGVQIAHDLRNQYVLGFSPANSTADGKYHKVNLKLAAPNAENDLKAYYRQGYFAPGQ